MRCLAPSARIPASQRGNLPMKRFMVEDYAKMWPRRVFLVSEGKRLSLAVRNVLKGPGVYVLYREDHPHYVGKTSRSLFNRIWNHATQPHDGYYLFWDYFSAFAVRQKKHRDEIEGILIAAMPTTANSSNPKFPRLKLPTRIARALHDKKIIVKPK